MPTSPVFASSDGSGKERPHGAAGDSDGLPKPDASPMIVDTIKVSRSGASNLL